MSKEVKKLTYNQFSNPSSEIQASVTSKSNYNSAGLSQLPKHPKIQFKKISKGFFQSSNQQKTMYSIDDTKKLIESSDINAEIPSSSVLSAEKKINSHSVKHSDYVYLKDKTINNIKESKHLVNYLEVNLHNTSTKRGYISPKDTSFSNKVANLSVGPISGISVPKFTNTIKSNSLGKSNFYKKPGEKVYTSQYDSAIAELKKESEKSILVEGTNKYTSSVGRNHPQLPIGMGSLGSTLGKNSITSQPKMNHIVNYQSQPTLNYTKVNRPPIYHGASYNEPPMSHKNKTRGGQGEKLRLEDGFKSIGTSNYLSNSSAGKVIGGSLISDRSKASAANQDKCKLSLSASKPKTTSVEKRKTNMTFNTSQGSSIAIQSHSLVPNNQSSASLRGDSSHQKDKKINLKESISMGENKQLYGNTSTTNLNCGKITNIIPSKKPYQYNKEDSSSKLAPNALLTQKEKVPLSYSLSREKDSRQTKDNYRYIYKNSTTTSSVQSKALIPDKKMVKQSSSVNSTKATDPQQVAERIDLNSEEAVLPMDAKFFILKYRELLTESEVAELNELLDKIYFLGELKKRITKHDSGVANADLNNSIKSPGNPKDKPIPEEGSDEELGSYDVKIGHHIYYRFEILSDLGKGSFGQAVKCFDHKHKRNTCVKIIKNKKKFTNQAKIEIRLLQYINQNDTNEESNVIKILSNFFFRGHVCIVFELLDINLYELLKYQDFVGLDMQVIRKIAIQLLYTLIFLQKSKIIHCDLKPENILLKTFGKTGIKVIDFGSSCFEGEKLYSYIQSRFYRAPEIILGLNYGIEIDMWSFGCIIIELYTGIPIFPGENERDQLNYIMEYFGQPPDELISNAKKKHHFFEFNETIQTNGSHFVPIKSENSRGKVRIPLTKKLERFLSAADDSFINLVRQCLEWDPTKRIKPDEAILHEWITVGMPQEILDFHRRNYEARIKSRLGDTGGNYPRKDTNETPVNNQAKAGTELKSNSLSSLNQLKQQLTLSKKQVEQINPLYKSSKL